MMKTFELSDIIYADHLKTNDIVKSVKKYCSNIRGDLVTRILKSLHSKFPNIFNEIKDKVKHLQNLQNKNIVPIESYIKMYIFDQLYSCPICGKLALNTSISCSIKCQGKLEEVKEKRKETNFKKYKY